MVEAVALDFDPYAIEVLTEPFSFHGMLRDCGPVFWLRKYGCYGMARYDQVHAALADWETYVSSRGVGLSDFAKESPWRSPSLLLETDPPLHDRTRGLMNRIVTLGAVRDLAEGWRTKANDLVDSVVNRGELDAVADFAEQFPLMVIPELIGLMEEGRENLIPYATAVFNAFGPRNALFEEADRASKSAAAWVANACKRENIRGGWGLAVYEASDRGDCSPEEAERLVRSFLSAGVDTTVNGIGTMLLALATHTEQWEMLRKNPELARKAIEESLRWGGVAQTFYRTTSCDVDIEGVTIPGGSKVLLFLASANRDPRKWTDPEAFDITRAASGHVGFGFGIHQCLGQMVARYEAQAVLDALIEKVGRIEVTGQPSYRLNNTLRALGSMAVILHRA